MIRQLTQARRSAIKKAQRGISTVQVAVTILVGSILILGGLGAFRYVTGAQSNNDATAISEWATRTQELGSSRGLAFFGVSGNVDAAGLQGVNFFGPAGAAAATPSGKTVAPSAWNADTNASASPNGLRLTITAYENQECRDLIPKIMGSVRRVTVTPTGGSAVVAALNGGLTTAATGGVNACSATAANVLAVYMRM